MVGNMLWHLVYYRPMSASKAIKDHHRLRVILEEERKRGKKVVFTNGCFDLIHVGHVSLLREAKKKGDVLVVAINSDESVRKLKGNHRPIFPEEERAETLAAMEMVDYVTVFSEEDPYKVIAFFKPDILVKGGDWSLNRIIGRDVVQSYGGEVLTFPEVEGHSSSRIIEKIKQIE